MVKKEDFTSLPCQKRLGRSAPIRSKRSQWKTNPPRKSSISGRSHGWCWAQQVRRSIARAAVCVDRRPETIYETTELVTKPVEAETMIGRIDKEQHSHFDVVVNDRRLFLAIPLVVARRALGCSRNEYLHIMRILHEAQDVAERINDGGRHKTRIAAFRNRIIHCGAHGLEPLKRRLDIIHMP